MNEEPLRRAVELFAAINFTVIGLSHLMQPRGWVEFFVWLRAKGHAGVFVNGMLSLTFGSIVVAFHNVWTGIPTILTIVGWLHVAKALVIMTLPRLGMRSLERVSLERTRELTGAAAGLLALAAVMWYVVLT